MTWLPSTASWLAVPIPDSSRSSAQRNVFRQDLCIISRFFCQVKLKNEDTQISFLFIDAFPSGSAGKTFLAGLDHGFGITAGLSLPHPLFNRHHYCRNSR